MKKFEASPYYLAVISGIGGLVAVLVIKLLATSYDVSFPWYISIPAVVSTIIRPLYTSDLSQLRVFITSLCIYLATAIIVLIINRLL